ncbi:hypothetical protein PN465_20405 [Nodularia spumigena CS-584]|jgi:hypothetical protein|uniref:Uncharacterized protein n=1 Tax=Nodularia spumigena UHCC 0060 TaxID=3110300 RepID=A0ABU5UUN6_NODSP|nr:hypothetical protein [Nodularia spumigena]EAW44913.1 hypothetical protein N9414_11052 [Nodularia spumigena CCY9414]MDB9384556.1 hypothetical protein [Nodularia spumigena CS-584]MEA5527480.1 hypothetical protein [Nodularia spumigena UHCC 0143]MEA5554913.1 hypothetical protein [Nodularia spumigena CH309]MEA5610024.1 hypothetical protein [Nodularia spumigena UHCC 0060]
MVKNVRVRAYTKVTKWYNLIYVSLITVSSIIVLICTALGIYTDVSVVEVLRLVTVILAGILAVLGIARQKLWAKWLAIAIYGLYIFLAIEGLVNSFLAEAAFKLFISSNILVVSRVGRVVAIVTSLIGVVLLLKKTRPKEGLEKTE